MDTIEEELSSPQPSPRMPAPPPAPGVLQPTLRRAPSTPRMGVVGFILSLSDYGLAKSGPVLDRLGIWNIWTVRLWAVVWFTGLMLSAFGLAAAKRDQRPSALCLVGVLLGLAPVMIVFVTYFFFD